MPLDERDNPGPLNYFESPTEVLQACYKDILTSSLDNWVVKGDLYKYASIEILLAVCGQCDSSVFLNAGRRSESIRGGVDQAQYQRQPSHRLQREPWEVRRTKRNTRDAHQPCV